jgi:hypothetical protein
MEQKTLTEVFDWYVKTDDFRVFFSDVTEEEFKAEMINRPRSMKKLIDDYWDNYLNGRHP